MATKIKGRDILEIVGNGYSPIVVRSSKGQEYLIINNGGYEANKASMQGLDAYLQINNDSSTLIKEYKYKLPYYHQGVQIGVLHYDNPKDLPNILVEQEEALNNTQWNLNLISDYDEEDTDTDIEEYIEDTIAYGGTNAILSRLMCIEGVDMLDSDWELLLS